jgi:translation initiation factor 3 subunit L
MYALLAICTTLSPGPTDESIMSIVKEHYADQLQTLQRGGPESLEIYKDLFLSSCPKYLSVNPPPYEDASLLEQYISNPPTDATVRHLELFLSDVEAVRGVSGVRNLLKLYTSIDASKLAAFNSVEGQGEKEILEQLMVLKGASRTYSHQTGEGSSTLLDGDRLVTNNLDFTIDAVSPSSLPNIILNSSTCHLFVEITAGLRPERLVLISGNGARRRNNLSQTIRRLLYP